MNKFYFLAITILLSASVKAQYRESQTLWNQLVWDDEKLNILVDTRIDFQDIMNNYASDNVSFHGQTFRVWLVGEIMPGFRYRVRHRLNKVPALERDGYTGATDHAWLAFDIGPQWTIIAGKQSVQIGTFENDYNGADVYMGTMVFNDFDGSMTGVNVAYKPGKQIFNFQVTNSDAPMFANDEYKNRAIALNFMWAGSLFNDVVRTRWGYGAFQHSKTKFYNWITVGTQLNIGKFTSEIDYYTGVRNMDYGAVVCIDTLGTRYVQDQSLSIHLEYNTGRWRPFIKGIWDKRFDKWADATAYRNLGFEIVGEFYPFKHPRLQDLRFHAAYTYKNTDFRGPFSHMKNGEIHTLLVGTRWIFKAK